MKQLIAIILLVVLAGCGHKEAQSHRYSDNATAHRQAEPPKPEHIQVLDQVNDAITRIHTFKADVSSVTRKRAVTITASGQFFYQQERNARLVLHAAVDNRLSTDMGSNANDFWFFNRRVNGREMYYCAYANESQARLQDMFDPAWMIESLNLRPINQDNLKAEKQGKNWIYAQPTLTSRQQERICIMTVDPTRSAITAHYLQTRNKQLIASMIITSFAKVDGIYVPKSIEIYWPGEEIRISWQFSGIVINKPINPVTFSMPELGLRKANLATGTFRNIND